MSWCPGLWSPERNQTLGLISRGFYRHLRQEKAAGGRSCPEIFTVISVVAAPPPQSQVWTEPRCTSGPAFVCLLI